MGGLGIDFNQWPTWLLVVLIAANLFKEQIGGLIGSITPTWIKDVFRLKAKRTLGRDEHEHLIEEVLLNGEIQDRITEQLRESRREETLIQVIRDKDRWLEGVLTKQLDKIVEETAANRRNSERTNNILTTIHITLSKLAERRTSDER